MASPSTPHPAKYATTDNPTVNPIAAIDTIKIITNIIAHLSFLFNQKQKVFCICFFFQTLTNFIIVVARMLSANANIIIHRLGKNVSRDIVKHPGATGIIAFLDEENIILVEQFRLALNRTILEIPAGKLNKNEDIKMCAKRELQEETGYIASKLEYLGCLATAPGFCDEIIYINQFKSKNKRFIRD